MKVYVSGPMTGYEEFNFPAFERACELLIDAGYEPVSPHRNGLPVESSWEDHLRADLRMLLEAEALATLDGWDASRGATLERHVALSLGMRCAPLAHFLSATEGMGSCEQ